MKYSICACDLELNPDFPFPLRGNYEECARMAHEIGFDGIELQIQDPSFYNGNILRKQIERYNLKVSAIATGLAYTFERLSMSDDDASVRKKTVERLKRQMDLAKCLDSQILIGIIRGRMKQGETKENFEEKLTDSMWQLLEYAKEINTNIVFEHINRFDGDVFNSTDRTMQFIEKFDSPFLFYNIDTYHMYTEDTSIEAAIKRSFHKLVLFHVSDVGRSLPDNQHFNFMEAARVLRELGYQEWLTLECKPLPTSEAATKEGFKFMKKVF